MTSIFPRKEKANKNSYWHMENGVVEKFCSFMITLFLMVNSLFATEETQYKPRGQTMDVGGYKLHYHSIGSGSPAVIIDSGLGGVSTDWKYVQQEIAKFTQVICYDRAGLAWSDTGPLPRTSKQIVHELHLLVEKANIPKPFILIGHSFGGINAQLYAITYPDDVLGLILVESAHEEQITKLPPHPLYKIFLSLNSPEDQLFQSTFGFGSFATKTYLTKKLSTIPEDISKFQKTFLSSAKHNETNGHEADSFPLSLEQFANSDRTIIENKPCIVLSAEQIEFEDLSPFGINKELREQIHEKQVNFQNSWNLLQMDLASKFTQSCHYIAEKSDHSIPWSQPELIIDAVRELVETNK